MGTAGSVSSNRVLLLAYVGGTQGWINKPDAYRPSFFSFVPGKLSGACSSTFSVPWADEGCGHWGLLVTDPSMRGKGEILLTADIHAMMHGCCASVMIGVASALVAVAEHRVAGQCSEVCAHACMPRPSARPPTRPPTRPPAHAQYSSGRSGWNMSSRLAMRTPRGVLMFCNAHLMLLTSALCCIAHRCTTYQLLTPGCFDGMRARSASSALKHDRGAVAASGGRVKNGLVRRN